MGEIIQFILVALLLAGSAIFIVGVIFIAFCKVVEFEDLESDKLVGDLDDEHRI